MILIYGKGKTGESLKNLSDFLEIPSKIIDDSEFFSNFNLKNYEKVVISPGIPFYHPIFKESKKNSIQIEGEIEFGYKFFNGKIISITGTDGKSTTTKMIYQILKSKNENVFIGGNYGIPFSEIILKVLKDKIQNPTVVLELSSFQIYSTKKFKPDVAVFLNFSEDHIDWHRKKKHYFLSKQKLFKNLDENSLAVLNYDDKVVRSIKTNAAKYFFSLHILPENLEGIYLRGNDILLRMNNKEKNLFKTDILNLRGTHNIQNMLASILVGILNKIPVEKIKKSIEEFKGLPHRLEFVGEINGITFYNDSKATTVQSVEKAVLSFDKNVILISGGINKGGDFSKLNPILKEKVKKVFLIGKDKEEIKNMIKGSTEVELTDTLEESIYKAFSKANKQDIILFSPGCSSFDMFKNYEDRGNSFKEIVNKLKVENKYSSPIIKS
jgi:UDP-N-acetylmuramoylalanine--D-glutamate ligase